MSENWNEAMVAAVLQKKWGKPECAFLRQVRNATGFNATTRTADALSIGLWPSRGMHLNGFEIKVSRADWLKELKQPEKAEEIARYCHFWWIAIPDRAMVKEGELPAQWGVVEVGSGSPKIVKQAPFTAEPQPPSLTFFASLMRSVCEDETVLQDIQKLMQKELWAAEQRGREEGAKQAKSTEAKVLESYRELTERVAEFERLSGVRLDRYSVHFNGQIGAAVKFLSNERGVAEAISSARERLQRLTEELGHVEAGLRAARKDSEVAA